MEKNSWNSKVKHPLQSWEWGEFRKKTGIKVIREDHLQITIHPIPLTPYTIGYLPKGPLPNSKQLETLDKIATENNCILIKCEPLFERADLSEEQERFLKTNFVEGKTLFTKYNFVLPLSKSEEEILAGMKQKTRYNIRVAEKRGVKVQLDDSKEAFSRYLELMEETAKRQRFYAHGREYHKKMWETLGKTHTAKGELSNNELEAHILTAKYQGEIITTWILFKFGETLYYPYGASTREHREVMANNLAMWEAIKLGKKWKLKYLDMWGALPPTPEVGDPWYGFHKFKEGYGGRHVEYVGTWDYPAKPIIYQIFRLAEKIRWFILHARLRLYIR